MLSIWLFYTIRISNFQHSWSNLAIWFENLFPPGFPTHVLNIHNYTISIYFALHCNFSSLKNEHSCRNYYILGHWPQQKDICLPTYKNWLWLWNREMEKQVFTHFKTNAKTIGISRFQHDKIQEAFVVNCNVSFKTIVPLSILFFITKPLVKFNCSTPFSYNKEFHNNLSRTNIFSSHSLKARFDGQTRTDRRCFQSS